MQSLYATNIIDTVVHNYFVIVNTVNMYKFIFRESYMRKQPVDEMPTCMHCSLTVLALILLYGGHYFSVGLPSKITQCFPQCMIMFPDSTYNNCLMVFTCML